jgi:phage tail sheath protein FI
LERKFKIKKDFYDLYGSEIYEEQAAAAWKLTMAHQAFGKLEQSWLKEAQQKEAALLKAEQEKVKAEQEKVKAEQEKVKAEKLAAEQKELLQKEKEAKKLLLKAERDKAKVQQKILLKAEKEKQVHLLKAEKEKQEQLLKAEKEKNQLKMLELGKKMLENGQDINFICTLLGVSESALRR